MLEIRWHGRGGQGAFTASKILGAAAVLNGKYALSFPSFGPERRGAPIQAFTKIADEKITDRSVVKQCDAIIFLDETLYTGNVLADLKEGGTVFINSKEPDKYHEDSVVAVNASAIAERIMGLPVSNTAMLAVFAVYTGTVEDAQLKKAMEFYLPNKVLEKNKLIVNEVQRIFDKEGVSYDKTNA